MVTRAKNDKVAGVIVQLVTVYVVYVLGWFKRPTEHLLHYKAMDSNMLAINVFSMVSVGVYPTVAFIFRGHNIVQSSVVMETAIVFFAIAFAVLCFVTVWYSTFPFLGTVRGYQGSFRITSNSKSLVVFLAETITVYVSGTIFHRALFRGKQASTPSGGVVGFTVATFNRAASAIKTLFHRISPFLHVPQFSGVVK